MRADESVGDELLLSAEEFWQLYDQNLLAEPRRNSDGTYRGTKIDHNAETALLADLIEFSVPRQSFHDFNYSADESFDRQVSPSLSDALLAVLERAEYQEDTPPNVSRISLVTRILRNDTLGPLRDIRGEPQTTREIVTHVHLRELSRGEATARLVALVPERSETFRAYSRLVLKGLQDGTWDLDQVEHLLSEATPSTEIVLWDDLRRLVLETLDESHLEPSTVCRFLRHIRPTAEDYELMRASGKISAVRTERDVLLQALGRHTLSGVALQEISSILGNHENEDLFLLADAIRALGRSNDKQAIRVLLECLDRGDMERYWGDIEEALQRICSGSELIPNLAFGFDVDSLSESDLAAMEGLDETEVRLERDYWKKIVAELPTSAAEWIEHDARSVFWEKRLRCALNTSTPEKILRELCNDEVPAVRHAAGSPG
jgi:hypothetical protein